MPDKKVEAPVVENPAPEANDPKKGNWIVTKNVPESFFAKDKDGAMAISTDKNGKEAYRLQMYGSEKGPYTAFIPTNMVHQNEGAKSVNIMGYENASIGISQQQKNEDGTFKKDENGKNVYDRSRVPLSEIKNDFDTQRHAYVEKQRAAAKEAPEAAAPSAESQVQVGE